MITSELNTKGNFYIPEEEENKCFGNLVIEGNIIKLELLGGLSDLTLKETGRRDIFRRNNKPEYRNVYGTTGQGYVALVKNHFGRSLNLKLIVETSESFSLAFIGDEEFNSDKKPAFKELRLRYIRLKDFVKGRIIQKVGANSAEGLQTRRIKIEAKVNDEPLLRIETKRYEIVFDSDYSQKIVSNDPSDFNHSIIERPIIRIVKKRGLMHRKEVLTLLFGIKEFLGFALRDGIYPTEAYGINHKGKDILRTQIHTAESEYNIIDSSNKHQFLFVLSQVEKDIGMYLENWLLLKKKSTILYTNYMTFLSSQDRSWETSVLKLILAIEDYFERNLKEEFLKRKEKLIPEEVIEDARSKIKKIENEELLGYLLGRIGSYNKEATFRQKFSFLYEDLPKHLKDSIDIEEDIDLISRVRNAIAHGGLTKKLFEEARNKELELKLVKLTEFCLMKSIGFNDKFIDEAVARPYY